MKNIINISELSNLPNNTLVVLKDTNDGVCLGIISNSMDLNKIEFKAKNISVDNSSVYAFMIRNNGNDIYKCLIPLNSTNNKSTVHKLINLDRFNLIIFKDGNEQDIFRIENINKYELNNMLLQALVEFDSSLDMSEEYIDNFYTCEQLWNK